MPVSIRDVFGRNYVCEGRLIHVELQRRGGLFVVFSDGFHNVVRGGLAPGYKPCPRCGELNLSVEYDIVVRLYRLSGGTISCIREVEGICNICGMKYKTRVSLTR